MTTTTDDRFAPFQHFEKIVALLPGFSIVGNDDDRQYRAYATDGKVAFMAQFTHEKGRIKLWGTTMDQKFSEIIRKLSNGRALSDAHITVSNTGDVKRSAADIERRLLPDVRRLTAEWEEKVKQEDARIVRRDALLEKLRISLGPAAQKTVSHNGSDRCEVYRSNYHIRGSLRVEAKPDYSAEEVEVKIDNLTPDQAVKLLKFLAKWQDEQDAATSKD